MKSIETIINKLNLDRTKRRCYELLADHGTTDVQVRDIVNDPKFREDAQKIFNLMSEGRHDEANKLIKEMGDTRRLTMLVYLCESVSFS